MQKSKTCQAQSPDSKVWFQISADAKAEIARAEARIARLRRLSDVAERMGRSGEPFPVDGAAELIE